MIKNVIASIINLVYEFHHELPNDLRLKTLFSDLEVDIAYCPVSFQDIKLWQYHSKSTQVPSTLSKILVVELAMVIYKEIKKRQQSSIKTLTQYYLMNQCRGWGIEILAKILFCTKAALLALSLYGGLYMSYKIFSLFYERKELKKYFALIAYAICLSSMIAHVIHLLFRCSTRCLSFIRDST